MINDYDVEMSIKDYTTNQRKYDIAELFKHLKDKVDAGRLVVDTFGFKQID